MSTTTRLARVIGLTRSFSLPTGGRDGAETVTPADPDADPFAGPHTHESARPGKPVTAVTAVESTAVAQVTTVEAEPVSQLVTPPVAEAAAPAGDDTDTRAQGAGLFDEIESDMASLLAALETVGSDRRPVAAAAFDDDEAPASEEDARSFALLSELNRLWATEPNHPAT